MRIRGGFIATRIPTSALGCTPLEDDETRKDGYGPLLAGSAATRTTRIGPVTCRLGAQPETPVNPIITWNGMGADIKGIWEFNARSVRNTCRGWKRWTSGVSSTSRSVQPLLSKHVQRVSITLNQRYYYTHLAAPAKQANRYGHPKHQAHTAIRLVIMVTWAARAEGYFRVSPRHPLPLDDLEDPSVDQSYFGPWACGCGCAWRWEEDGGISGKERFGRGESIFDRNQKSVDEGAAVSYCERAFRRSKGNCGRDTSTKEVPPDDRQPFFISSSISFVSQTGHIGGNSHAVRGLRLVTPDRRFDPPFDTSAWIRFAWISFDWVFDTHSQQLAERTSHILVDLSPSYLAERSQVQSPTSRRDTIT